jgi:hypothetical protein
MRQDNDITAIGLYKKKQETRQTYLKMTRTYHQMVDNDVTHLSTANQDLYHSETETKSITTTNTKTNERHTTSFNSSYFTPSREETKDPHILIYEFK